ncbi:MAG: hypothetical protein WBW61_01480 [Rhodanobacteraceae bacterium]
MKAIAKAAVATGLSVALGACSTLSRISSPTRGTELHLKDRVVTLPAAVKLKGTSFGNYEFKAVDPGHEPFYGILPLAFKGGHLAVDIIFFAPATLFNLRGAFPFYDIDVENGLIRYKESREDPWREYRPKTIEHDRARDYFERGVENDDGGG